VVERGDSPLWLKVLDESNADRKALIDQVRFDLAFGQAFLPSAFWPCAW